MSIAQQARDARRRISVPKSTKPDFLVRLRATPFCYKVVSKRMQHSVSADPARHPPIAQPCDALPRPYWSGRLSGRLGRMDAAFGLRTAAPASRAAVLIA